MPIVPYLHHDGNQVPLHGLLPSTSSPISSALLPTYSSIYPQDTLIHAPDASPSPIPSINIPNSLSPSHEQAHVPSFITVDRPINESDIQMKGRKPAIAAAGTFFSLFSFSQYYQSVLFPKITPPSERAEEQRWVNSSHSWLDRKVCNWFGLCGLTHLNRAGWTNWADSKKEGPDPFAETDLNEFRKGASYVDIESFLKAEHRTLGEIPDYVVEHAPLIHLYSGEEFWPCDVAEHLIHTTPHLNYTALQASSDHPNLTNLNDLNRWGRFVYLQSDDNVEDRPAWLGGKVNIPDEPEESEPDSEPVHTYPPNQGQYEEDVEGEHEDWFHVGIGSTEDKGGIRPTATTLSSVPKPTKAPQDEFWHSELIKRRMGRRVVGGRSDAPATLIVVDKGDGVVDAFWFFFYSYNLGNMVFNVRFGNHVGDWEHTCIRFHHGEPKAVFFSEHSFGEAYTWDAVEKIGKRPVGFSATGTHAMYATPGVHPYILPGGILHDVTDRGPLWDPSLNLYAYTYDYKTQHLKASTLTPAAPIEWFYFKGHWGDKFYPLSDPRQYRFLGQYHYVNGPLGPWFKNLGRKEICQGNDECLLKKSRRENGRGRVVKRFPDVGEGEEMSEEDIGRVGGDE